MWWVPLAMAGAGMAKNELVDKPQARRQAKAEAAKTYYSPWTGMQGQTVQTPSTLDAGLKWGATGLMLGQGMQNAGMFANAPGAANANPVAMNYLPQQQQQNPWSQMMGGYGNTATA